MANEKMKTISWENRFVLAHVRPKASRNHSKIYVMKKI
jgi:hypothetical protein